MFHSSIFTMASNITPRRRRANASGRARHDLHGSLQEILDAEDVNVSTALPTVPLDATNPFINPNQTLADIIPDRNLGPLSTLKITDADLIIRNLNNKLNAAAKKNDASTALLQRMDQHQKQNRSPSGRTKSQNQTARRRKGNRH